MIIIPELSWISDFQVSRGIGANNGLHFMPSRILTPLARQSDNPWIWIFLNVIFLNSRRRRTKWDRRDKSLQGETRLSKAVLRALLKSICIYQTFKVQKWKTLLYFTIFAVRMTIFMSLFKKKKTKIERKLKIHIIRLVGEGLIVIIPSFVSLFSPLTPSYHMYSVSIW